MPAPNAEIGMGRSAEGVTSFCLACTSSGIPFCLHCCVFAGGAIASCVGTCEVTLLLTRVQWVYNSPNPKTLH